MEKITYQSCSPASYGELLSGAKLPSITLDGALFMPADVGTGPLPLVLICIGSMGHASGREELYSDALTRAGFTVFIPDGYTQRGFAETVTDQSRLSSASSAADMMMAFRRLADDPRFDRRRVALLGYSRGGTVAAMCHDERLQDAVLGPDLRFAAHIALYPSCSPQWRNPRPSRARMLMIVGGADNMAPSTKSLAYGARIRAAGGQVEELIFPEAHHSFDSRVAAEWSEKVINQANATILVEDDGEMLDEAGGLRLEGDWAAFYRELTRRHGRQGGTTGHGPLPRDIAIPPILRFLTDNLGDHAHGSSSSA